jgi:hypothetical protein
VDLAESAARCVAAVRTALETETDPKRGRALVETATTLEALVPLPAADPTSLQSVTLSSLYEKTRKDLLHGLRACRLDLDVVGADPELTVLDAAGRSVRALSALAMAGIHEAEAGGRITVRAEDHKGHVRLRVASRVNELSFLRMTGTIRDIGGDAGCVVDGAVNEAWIAIPKA